MEHSTLVGYSILVVEDEPLVALSLETTLQSAGALVCKAATAGEALHFVAQAELSAAVLDYDRSIKDGHSIARRLTALGLPFVFYKHSGPNETWPHAPVLRKPVSGREVVDTLRRLLRPEAAAEIATAQVG